MAGGISRNEIIDRLTAALGSITADRDRQRAEVVARELGELGLLGRRSLAQDVAGIFRHPVVAGSTLAVISGILASLVIPAVTRVWQDRPRELELKRSLVGKLSESVTQTVLSTRYTAGDLAGVKDDDERHTLAASALIRTTQSWRITSANVRAELTTYFRGTVLPATWSNYESIVSAYTVYALNIKRIQNRKRTDIVKHFKALHFRAASAENEKNTWLGGKPENHLADVRAISELLLLERDQLTSDIVDARAAGFSHGFWILT